MYFFLFPQSSKDADLSRRQVLRAMRDKASLNNSIGASREARKKNSYKYRKQSCIQSTISLSKGDVPCMLGVSYSPFRPSLSLSLCRSLLPIPALLLSIPFQSSVHSHSQWSLLTFNSCLVTSYHRKKFDFLKIPYCQKIPCLCFQVEFWISISRMDWPPGSFPLQFLSFINLVLIGVEGIPVGDLYNRRVRDTHIYTRRWPTRSTAYTFHSSFSFITGLAPTPGRLTCRSRE